MTITQPNMQPSPYPAITLRDIPHGTVFRHGGHTPFLCLKTLLGVIDLSRPTTVWAEPHTLFLNYQVCEDVELIVRDKR